MDPLCVISPNFRYTQKGNKGFVCLGYDSNISFCELAIVFITYLLEDEQELSLGMFIRLQHIYNFLLFHAIILSILNV